MSKSQAEIKAIEAQLRSIRANPGSPVRTPPTVMESSVASPVASATAANVRHHSASGQPTSGQSAPTRPMTRRIPQPTAQPTAQPTHNGQPSLSLPPLAPMQPPAAPQTFQRAQLAAMVERLQQQTAAHVQQYRQLQAQSFQPADYILDRSLQILDAQVQHINHLSAVQEAAILELKTMAETLEQEWNIAAQHSDDNGECDSLPICEYISAVVPTIEQDEDGVYVLSSRSIDLFKAEREAKLTAQALRHWGNRDQPQAKSSWRWLQNLVTPPNAAPESERPPQRPTGQATANSGMQPKPSAPQSGRRRSRRVGYFSWRESVALLVGAMLVRGGLDWMLVTFSLPWIPAIALLVTPAAIAVYRTNRTPHSGLVWTYRLLVIMIGLLLGGRLL